MEEEKPIGKTERCQRKKKRKPEEIADVEVKRREPIKRAGVSVKLLRNKVSQGLSNIHWI